MKIAICFLYIALIELVRGESNDKEHVHFKIHVPKIIKHHFHTKTIFVHLHEKPMKKKKKIEAPKTYHKKEKHDWSFWKTYGHHQDDEENNYIKNYHNPTSHQDSKNQNSIHPHDFSSSFHREQQNSINFPKNFPTDVHQHYNEENYFSKHPNNIHDNDSYLKQSNFQNSPKNNNKQHFDDEGKGENGIVGYSYPPQYAVHEDVHDSRPNEVDSFSYNYEKGYRKRLRTEAGHQYVDEANKFHDQSHEDGDQSEEGDDSEEGFKDDVEVRTHAGRYFLDDPEYGYSKEAKSSLRRNG